MTTFKIIGGITACILMGWGNVPKPIAPAAPSVGSDNPDAYTTVEPSTPAVVSLPQETTKADSTPAVVPILSDAPLRAVDYGVSGQGPGRAVSLPQPTLAEQMLAESNSIRANAIPPKPPQTLDERLCNAAQNQADYIAKTGQLSHNVNGDPRSRAAKYGFPSGDFYSVREVIAVTGSVESAFSNWSQSSGHYATIIGDYDLCGFGMAEGRSGKIWVGVYGHESSPQPIRLTTYLSNPPAAPATQFMQCGPNGCYVPATRYTKPQSQQPAQQPQTYQRRGLFGGRFRRR